MYAVHGAGNGAVAFGLERRLPAEEVQLLHRRLADQIGDAYPQEADGWLPAMTEVVEEGRGDDEDRPIGFQSPGLRASSLPRGEVVVPDLDGDSARPQLLPAKLASDVATQLE